MWELFLYKFTCEGVFLVSSLEPGSSVLSGLSWSLMNCKISNIFKDLQKLGENGNRHWLLKGREQGAALYASLAENILLLLN